MLLNAQNVVSRKRRQCLRNPASGITNVATVGVLFVPKKATVVYFVPSEQFLALLYKMAAKKMLKRYLEQRHININTIEIPDREEKMVN